MACRGMKSGVIFLVTFYLLAKTALTVTTSEYSIIVQPGPVEVKQGNNVSLWCQFREDGSQTAIPVHWQSPPKFRTRTMNCQPFGPPFQRKYVMSCSERNNNRWYNMTVTDVRWADRGIYRCIHTRYMGIVDVQVLVPVREVTYVSYITSNMSKDVDALLTCTTDCAYPAPTISWFENDQPFKGSPIVTSTKSGCTGDRKGQKRTISKVTVTGKYVDKERKESEIYCVAENVIGEQKISRRIYISYDDNTNDSPEKHDHAASDDVKKEREKTVDKAAANVNNQDAWFTLLPLGLSIFTAETSTVTWLNDFLLWLIVFSLPEILLTLLMAIVKVAYNWLFETLADQRRQLLELPPNQKTVPENIAGNHFLPADKTDFNADLRGIERSANEGADEQSISKSTEFLKSTQGTVSEPMLDVTYSGHMELKHQPGEVKKYSRKRCDRLDEDSSIRKDQHWDVNSDGVLYLSNAPMAEDSPMVKRYIEDYAPDEYISIIGGLANNVIQSRIAANNNKDPEIIKEMRGITDAVTQFIGESRCVIIGYESTSCRVLHTIRSTRESITLPNDRKEAFWDFDKVGELVNASKTLTIIVVIKQTDVIVEMIDKLLNRIGGDKIPWIEQILHDTDGDINREKKELSLEMEKKDKIEKGIAALVQKEDEMKYLAIGNTFAGEEGLNRIKRQQKECEKTEVEKKLSSLEENIKQLDDIAKDAKASKELKNRLKSTRQGVNQLKASMENLVNGWKYMDTSCGHIKNVCDKMKTRVPLKDDDCSEAMANDGFKLECALYKARWIALGVFARRCNESLKAELKTLEERLKHMHQKDLEAAKHEGRI